MRIVLKIGLFILLPFFTNAQMNIDSLKMNLANAINDSARYHACKYIYDYYEETNRDSAFYYTSQALLLARKNNKKLAEILSLNNKAYQLTGMGRYAESLKYLLEAFQILEDPSIGKEKAWMLFTAPFSGDNRLLMLCYTHHIFGILMWQTDNNSQALIHFSEARKISSEIGHKVRQLMADMNLGRCYLNNNQLDSALLLENEAVQLAFKTNFKKYLGQMYSIIGGIYQKKNDRTQEKQYYYMAHQASKEQNNLNNLNANYFRLAKYYLEDGEKDSALYYARKNLEVIRQLGPVTGLLINLGTVYENIYLSYQLTNQHDSIFKYQRLTLLVKDSLYKIRIKDLTEFQNATLNEQLRLQNAEKEKVVYQNKIRIYFLLAGIGVLLLFAIIFYRNNQQKNKAKIKIEQAYNNLKATQQQLIQSEKMASLGELTAGIAHEIQNPLNFVNNFSEVNREMIAEMKDEIDRGNYEEVKLIANNLEENEEKINHHGKRADAIVKGMLQHSRASTGQKEMTDINALCDEYLRLTYHGLRAKDKLFNAKLETDFDPAVGKINIIPQEIGRVVLNLINNAFYAVIEKQKENIPGYEAAVTISTASIQPPLGPARAGTDGGRSIQIKIADNGGGISQNIVDKIFQPFFTTKPTGQGTGLGLSLSYDIVKAHGGEIKVQTKEGEGSEFIIQLPLSKTSGS